MGSGQELVNAGVDFLFNRRVEKLALSPGQQYWAC
jgi:hypothetical protein